jgi:hypothetical protein
VIVYGDPAFSISPAKAALALRSLAVKARSDLHACRDLLIACGQIEQAISDGGGEDMVARRATDRAADHFIAALHGTSCPATMDEFAALFTALSGFDTELRVKLPEGYAFYSVFPEQYVTATTAWLKQHAPTGRVLVLGIRSIGTSLSAVVAAELRANGVTTRRMTTRPSGHPFQRKLEIDFIEADFMTRAFSHAIVVDEGPGLSGSSIAAAVSAVRNRGIANVAIFPSHAKEPGNAASQAVLECWRNTPKFVFPILDGNFQQSPLYEPLKNRSEALLESRVTNIRDLSAGQWRDLTGARCPAVPELERSKLLFTCSNGRAVLWKFAGLGCGRGFGNLSEEACLRQNRLGRMGWCGLPLDTAYGFIATEWIDARQANADDLAVPNARRLARYIADAARPALNHSARNEALERLREMMLCNIREALGPEWEHRAPHLQFERAADLPSYGDGRMAPYEWVQSGGRLLKTDVWGHDFDHSCIGQQSILWDVGGTLIEWDLEGDVKQAFLTELRKNGLTWTEPELHCHCIAYLSFKLGLASIFGDIEQTGSRAERVRAALAAKPVSPKTHALTS